MREDWVKIPFGELCTFSQGIQVPIKEQFKEYRSDRVRFLRIVDFTQNNEPERFVKRSEGNHLVGKDDISMVRYGTVGFVCTGKQGAIANNLFRIIPNIKIEKKYLIQFLKSSLFKQFINAKGATMQALSFGLIKLIQIPLPPLPIQRAIVHKIENLFASLEKGIADLKKAQEQLKVYRQAVLKRAFEGGFTHNNNKTIETIVNDEKTKIPLEWSIIELGSVVKLQGGYAFKSAEYVDSGVPIVKIKNIHFQDLNWSDTTYIDVDKSEEFKEYKLAEGDVLIAMTRPVIKSLNNVKTVVVKKSDLPAYLNQRVGRFKIMGDVDKEYLKYFIFTDFFKKRVVKESSSSQQPNISSGKIENFDFILPKTIKEQHQIVREIESRLSVCDKVEQSITDGLEKSEALRQSILKKAFEGKLLSESEIEQCKQEADYEPASVLLERIKKEKN